VIDLHTHILPGLDDGPETLEESIAVARAAVADGVAAVAATPHIRDDYPTTPAEMERAVASLRARLAAAGIPLRILPGGEIAFEQLGRSSIAELRRFGLGGNPSYLLVETPYYGLPLDLDERLFRLRAAGITPVLAHPERNRELQDDLDRVVTLVRSGGLVQVTAASLHGRAGKRARSTAKKLVTSGLAHLVASDTHGPSLRRDGLASIADEIGDAGLATWLTTSVPVAIVDGTPLPPRPQRRRRVLRRRRSRALGAPTAP
jgi:protein-tyrosine phosphatase